MRGKNKKNFIIGLLLAVFLGVIALFFQSEFLADTGISFKNSYVAAEPIKLATSGIDNYTFDLNAGAVNYLNTKPTNLYFGFSIDQEFTFDQFTIFHDGMVSGQPQPIEACLQIPGYGDNCAFLAETYVKKDGSGTYSSAFDTKTRIGFETNNSIYRQVFGGGMTEVQGAITSAKLVLRAKDGGAILKANPTNAWLRLVFFDSDIGGGSDVIGKSEMERMLFEMLGTKQQVPETIYKKKVKIEFEGQGKGSIKLNGTEYSEATELEIVNNQPLNIEATPAAGNYFANYYIYGRYGGESDDFHWISEKSYEIKPVLESDIIIRGRFYEIKSCPVGASVFNNVGGKVEIVSGSSGDTLTPDSAQEYKFIPDYGYKAKGYQYSNDPSFSAYIEYTAGDEYFDPTTTGCSCVKTDDGRGCYIRAIFEKLSNFYEIDVKTQGKGTPTSGKVLIEGSSSTKEFTVVAEQGYFIKSIKNSLEGDNYYGFGLNDRIKHQNLSHIINADRVNLTGKTILLEVVFEPDGTTEICDNQKDDDNDSKIDCLDENCSEQSNCSSSKPDEGTNNGDETGDEDPEGPNNETNQEEILNVNFILNLPGGATVKKVPDKTKVPKGTNYSFEIIPKAGFCLESIAINNGSPKIYDCVTEGTSRTILIDGSKEIYINLSRTVPTGPVNKGQNVFTVTVLKPDKCTYIKAPKRSYNKGERANIVIRCPRGDQYIGDDNVSCETKESLNNSMECSGNFVVDRNIIVRISSILEYGDLDSLGSRFGMNSFGQSMMASMQKIPSVVEGTFGKSYDSANMMLDGAKEIFQDAKDFVGEVLSLNTNSDDSII